MRKIKEKPYLLLILVELILLIVLLSGCFQKREKVEYSLGESVVLTPGVYELCVQTLLLDKTAEGQSLTVELQSENAYYRSLRTNAVTIYPDDRGPQNVVISAWVTDRISDAHVQCDFSGEKVVLTGLELYRTSRGNRIRLFTVFVCFILFDGLFVLHRKIRDGRVTQKQQVVIWVLAAGILITYFPYLTDYFTITEGTEFYLARIAKGMKISFDTLFLFIPIGLKSLGFPIVTAYKLWVLLVVSATALIVYHMFYLCVREEYAALFGSMFYLLMPYHLFCIYKRGDIGEALFLTFLPVVVCGIYLLAVERKRYDYRKALCYVIVGGIAETSSYMLLTDTAEGSRVLQVGSAAFLLFLVYLVRTIRMKGRISSRCGFWAGCGVFTIAMALLHIPGRWMAIAALMIALFVTFFYSEAHEERFVRIALGMVALLAVCSGIYHVNRIAYTSEAVYLYDEQNMEYLYRDAALQKEGGMR